MFYICIKIFTVYNRDETISNKFIPCMLLRSPRIYNNSNCNATVLTVMFLKLVEYYLIVNFVENIHLTGQLNHG